MADYEFRIGGKAGHTAATDYTGQVVRLSFTKNFCGEYDFDMFVDGVDKATDGTAIAKDNNVFIMIDDGGVEYLLMKGQIESIKWADKYRCQIAGVQCKRGSSGGTGGLHHLKAPQLTQLGEINLSDLLTDTTWFAGAKVFKDDGTSGEGKGLRPW